MIEARELTKRFGNTVAVDHLSFTVLPGRVTGFLGPNGAGKSTTMRMIVGLDHANSGTATINGKPYAQLVNPLRVVGALLEAKSVHSGRSARNHLLFLAQTQGLPASRVDEMLELVGLRDVAGKRAGGFSLGMSQRLGVAAALLGDPQVLLLDEPVNGLDPEGVLWIRNLMKHLASQGKTVLVSSHLMNEMAVTADHLIVIGRGRLLADAATDEVIARGSGQSVRVRTPDPDRLTRLIQAEGGSVAVSTAAAGTAAAGTGAAGTGAAGSVTTAAGDGRPPDSGEAPVLTVTGLPAPRIGELAASASIVLHELTPQLATLEDAFLELTADSLEFGHFGSEPPAAVTDGSPR
ncbi:MAG TPA: ATP-binding cassette domain-containing protein [Streptosporangiaceae bacterium]|jgi:ABC-2 type transport system ATP-binding protein|nr:ATP-binding cassette domain-containing protein [Streptosporangiaceae bacterium]